MTDDPVGKESERIRLLEFQLDYLRAEMLHLTHERYRLVYSVSGHIYRFLRPSRRASPISAPRSRQDFAESLRPKTRRLFLLL